MKKAVLCLTMLALLVSGFCLNSGTAKAADEPIVLTLNLGMPPIHQRWVKALKPWCDELERRSNGRLVVEPYFADALGKRSEALNSVRTGIADLAEAPFSTNPGQFPFHSQIFSAARPSMALGNAQAMLNEFYAVYPQLLSEEIKGVKLLFTHAYPVGDCVMTKSSPIRTLDELKGKKIGFQGGGLRFDKMQALGATVVGMSMSDLYQALQSGIIDGIAMDFDPLISRRYGEEVKHVTLLNITGTGFYMVMNQATYDSLPPDLQKIMDEMAGEYADKLLDGFWSENVYGSLEKWMNEMGGTVYALSDADYARADAMTDKPIKAWFNTIKLKGVSGDKLYQTFQTLEEKYFAPWDKSEVYKYVKK